MLTDQIEREAQYCLEQASIDAKAAHNAVIAIKVAKLLVFSLLNSSQNL
jgi:hypothetical protein